MWVKRPFAAHTGDEEVVRAVVAGEGCLDGAAAVLAATTLTTIISKK